MAQTGSDNMAEHTKHFMDVSKRIRELEGKNTGKRLQQKKEQLADLSKTVQDLETMYKKATEEVEKEKADVDKMKEPSTRDFFQDQATFDKQMSIEEEEYLEAVSNQEMIKKQLDGVSAQKKQVEKEVAENGKEMESLLSLYDEQDEILGKIFNGAYGSDLENKLEAEFDALLEREQRIQVARYKWSNAKVLLQHAVKQMGTACNKWMEVEKIPKNMQAKYMLATETRNNLVAASQNISSAHRYLNQIKFPYCEPGEVETLNRATTNVYIDMQHPDRHKHAYNCYHITFRRASALLQWFDNVINKTINKDLQNARQELKTVEKRLREERLKLIKEKLGSEADGLTLDDMGGEDDFDDNEPDAELMQVCQADGSNNMLSVDDGSVKAATPLPLNELAPAPSQDELFGNIEQLKQQHEKEMAEFEKAQETNKARMEQGLQEKLAARRNRRARRFQE